MQVRGRSATIGGHYARVLGNMVVSLDVVKHSVSRRKLENGALVGTTAELMALGYFRVLSTHLLDILMYYMLLGL
jgi:hypothetical protein